MAVQEADAVGLDDVELEKETDPLSVLRALCEALTVLEVTGLGLEDEVALDEADVDS